MFKTSPALFCQKTQEAHDNKFILEREKNKDPCIPDNEFSNIWPDFSTYNHSPCFSTSPRWYHTEFTRKMKVNYHMLPTSPLSFTMSHYLLLFCLPFPSFQVFPCSNSSSWTLRAISTCFVDNLAPLIIPSRPSLQRLSPLAPSPHR